MVSIKAFQIYNIIGDIYLNSPVSDSIIESNYVL